MGLLTRNSKHTSSYHKRVPSSNSYLYSRSKRCQLLSCIQFFHRYIRVWPTRPKASSPLSLSSWTWQAMDGNLSNSHALRSIVQPPMSPAPFVAEDSNLNAKRLISRYNQDKTVAPKKTTSPLAKLRGMTCAHMQPPISEQECPYERQHVCSYILSKSIPIIDWNILWLL